MYELSVKRDFIGQHFLIGGDWGPENELHSHHYRLELRLTGHELNEHGYLVDIVEVNTHLDEMVNRYRDTTLNDLPEFKGLNPSIEHFSRIVCKILSQRIHASNVEQIKVIVYEDDVGWSSYEMVLE